MQQWVWKFRQQRFKVFLCENHRVNASDVEVAPGNTIIARCQNCVRIEIQAFRIIAPFEETCLLHGALVQVIMRYSPRFRAGFQLNRFHGLDFDVGYRTIRIHPNRRNIFGCLNLYRSGFQFQGLFEIARVREWIRCHVNSNSPQLQQLTIFAPCIRFRDQENYVSVLFRPHIGCNITIAYRH